MKQDDKFGYINTKGEVVIPFKYTDVGYFYNGLAKVGLSVDGKTLYGYINKAGEEVVPAAYTNISQFSTYGYATASIYDAGTQKSTCYLISTSGAIKQMDGTSLSFVNGGKYIRVFNNSNVYTYFDLDGNQVNFDGNRNGIVANDLMAVQKDGKYGYINKDGNNVIPADYISANAFDANGIAFVSKENGSFYGIDTKGNTVIQPDQYTSIRPFVAFSNPEDKKNYMVAKNVGGKNKFGCVDYEGNVIVPAVYDSIDSGDGFSNGLMAVMNNRQVGFVDLKGNLVIPTVYDEVGKFSNGLAAARKANKWGFIDTAGNTVIPFDYDDVNMDGFVNSLVAVKKDGKCGAIDTAGNTVIPFDYENVWDIYITEEGFIWTVIYNGSNDYNNNRSYSLYMASSFKAAVPTQSAVLIDGKKVPFDAFTVDGNNYFKLRDLAKVLNGTKKQFEIGWDSSADSITISTGKGYTSVGGELTVSGNSENKSAALTNSKILLDGKELKLTVYNIDGSNYFKLRDLAQNINFGVGWDSGANTISVDTASSYTK